MLPLTHSESIHMELDEDFTRGLVIPKRLDWCHLYLHKFLLKQILVIILEDQVSGPSSPAQGASKQTEVPWWSRMCDFYGSSGSRREHCRNSVWLACLEMGPFLARSSWENAGYCHRGNEEM